MRNDFFASSTDNIQIRQELSVQGRQFLGRQRSQEGVVDRGNRGSLRSLCSVELVQGLEPSAQHFTSPTLQKFLLSTETRQFSNAFGYPLGGLLLLTLQTFLLLVHSLPVAKRWAILVALGPAPNTGGATLGVRGGNAGLIATNAVRTRNHDDTVTHNSVCKIVSLFQFAGCHDEKEGCPYQRPEEIGTVFSVRVGR
jgi:hypothetical protein